MTTFKKITEEMNELYERKNHDYGDSFTDTYKKFGLVAPLVRMNDKINRLNTLAVKKQQVNDEAIEDTLIDIANYAVMTIMLMKGETKND